jgi:hypothetical protein
MPKELDAAVLRLRAANWLPKIAQQLSLTRQATSKWRRVPAARVHEVSDITGYSLHFLRPDLYRPGDRGPPVKRRMNHRTAAHA